MQQVRIGKELAHHVLAGAVHGIKSHGNVGFVNGLDVEVGIHMIEVHLLHVYIFEQALALEFFQFRKFQRALFGNEVFYFRDLSGRQRASEMGFEFKTVVRRRVVTGRNDHAKAGAGFEGSQ